MSEPKPSGSAPGNPGIPFTNVSGVRIALQDEGERIDAFRAVRLAGDGGPSAPGDGSGAAAALAAHAGGTRGVGGSSGAVGTDAVGASPADVGKDGPLTSLGKAVVGLFGGFSTRKPTRS